jgi:hypothetical protein
MATSNRVFVSPGVYTSELDLTFVAQSVGVTTLGLVGETLKGPAFEPVLITSFDEFRTYFGTTSPEKDGNGNPKYELGYVAKSYLEESNQLFVTRVLGLTGYRPFNTFGIRTLGGVTVDTTATPTTTNGGMSTTAVTLSAFYTELSDKLTTDGTTIPEYISGTTFNGGNWFTVGPVPNSSVSGLTGTTISSPIGTNNGKNWYNVYYTESTPGVDTTIDGVYSYLFVYPDTGNTFTVTRFKYPASLNTDYSNVIVAALRSRGRYVGQSLTLEVTNSSNVNITSSTLDSDPLSEFKLSVNGLTGGLKSYQCSMDLTSSKYIGKVIGNSVFDKSYVEFPLYLHESYPNLVKNLYKQGLIRGLSTSNVYNLDQLDFAERWSTALSPTVVSEVRGGKVADLFDVITISDGEASNQQVKITIANINLDTKEFDLLVRDFNDTDENVVALEKYSRCSMDPEVPGYIAKKLGTSDGEYELKSKFIMLEMKENAPADAIPAGFKGFSSNTSFGTNSILGSLMYKTEYFDAGDIVGYESDGSPITTNGDKPRKVSLGFSTQEGFKYDNDLLKYKGLSSEDTTTYAFHLSVNAASITGITYKTTPYDLEGLNKDKLENITFRKFTFAAYGGFDGWDIYRNVKTNTDQYIFGKNTYVSNWESNGGVFSSTEGNSDYYAFLKGIETFSNPEAVNINVFATPGLNFYDHNSLTNQAIDMVEEERADSLYIINSPNVDDAEEVVGMLDDLGYDSNYSATYWPWIQVRDGDNATQLYIPPTGEVLRNVALTDNVSYPWFAVAGYSRGLVKSIKAVKKLTLDERDILYKGRINPIATFSDTGTIIWGNKTLQVRESALDRINVRRLLLRARKLISAVAVRLLFEQNDDQVRNEFLRLVNPIMEAIKKERGLYDFRVTVSNAPEDIDANTLRGKIYIKPTRSLEFIDLEFIITPTGASFDNI